MTDLTPDQRLDHLAAQIDSGRLDEAIAELTRSDRAENQSARGAFLLAVARIRGGDKIGARLSFQTCVELDPGVAGAWRAIAAISFELGDYPKVIDSLIQYRKFFPYDRETLGWQVFALQEVSALGEARALVEEYLVVYPYDHQVSVAAAFVYERNRLFLRAAVFAGRTWENEMASQLLVSCAVNLSAAGLAEACIDGLYPDPASRQANPLHAKNRCELAGLAGNPSDALMWHEQATALGYEDKDVMLNRSLLLLSAGRYREGWAYYRLRHPDCKRLLLPEIPEWNGEDIRGKTIVVHSEQGCGDVIQFIRYLPFLRETGATVLFNSYPDILKLLQSDARAETGVRIDAEVLDHIDYQTFLMDFPSLLRPQGILDFEHGVPYLFAPEAKLAAWREKLQGYSGFRVGIAWAGNPKHANDHNRSAALMDFEPLAAVPGIAWFSLQKGGAVRELETECRLPGMVSLDSEIVDFSDTAAILANLDLVICVDTSIAHLAGALGVPCWVVLPKLFQDWRWYLGGDTCPWYPTLRVFRQREGGEWSQLFAQQVRPALGQAILASRRVVFESRRCLLLEILSGDAEFTESAIPNDVAEDLGEWIDAARTLALECDRPALLDSLWAQFAGDQNSRLQSAWGELLLKRGRIDDALQCWQPLRDAGHLTPKAYVTLSEFLLGKSPPDAEAVCREAIACYGESGDLLTLLGRSLIAQWLPEKAQLAFEAAIRCCDRLDQAHVGLASILQARSPWAACDHYQRAVMLRPTAAEHWRRIGYLAMDCGADALAEMIFAQQSGENGEAYAGHMVAVTNQQRLTEADRMLEAVDRAKCSDWQGRYGIAYVTATLRPAFCEAELRTLVEDFPRARDARLLYGFWLLSGGRFREGWVHYRQGNASTLPGLTAWQGESLSGKRILVFQDQGYGDLLQFLPLAHLLGTTSSLDFAVMPGAESFVQQEFSGSRVFRRDQPVWRAEDYDYCVGIMHLPGLLDVDLLHPPLSAPYYNAPTDALPEGILDDLRADPNRKVGIAWAGSPLHVMDRVRSSCLDDWRSLGTVEGVSLVCLQKDAPSNQAFGCPDLRLLNHASECDTLEKTAQLIGMLDLVISVDTGVAHLAAGLGKETWILVADAATDFRWGRNTERCPWYPTVRLIRRGRDQSWADVLERVSIELRDRVSRG